MAGKISDEANLTASQLATGDEFELRDISNTTNAATGELMAIAANELAMAMQLLGTAEGYSTFSNANYTMLAADRVIMQVGTMSASRTVTLVAAATVPDGTVVLVGDNSQSVTSTNTIVVTPDSGGDTINGTVSSSITTAGGVSICVSTALGNWTVIPLQRPGAVRLTGGIILGAVAVGKLLGPWVDVDVAASLTASAMFSPGGTVFEMRMIRGGSITGISVHSTEARTAGTLTVDATINGTVTGLQAAMSSAVTGAQTTQAVDLDTYVAGDRLGVKITTTSGWTPTTADIAVMLEVVG